MTLTYPRVQGSLHIMLVVIQQWCLGWVLAKEEIFLCFWDGVQVTKAAADFAKILV